MHFKPIFRPQIVQTICGLALCVVNRLLELAWLEVSASRRNKDGKHLPLNLADNLPRNPPCPSRSKNKDRFPFLCPCVANGPRPR